MVAQLNTREEMQSKAFFTNDICHEAVAFEPRYAVANGGKAENICSV